MKKVLVIALLALSAQANAHSLIVKTKDTATLSGKVNVEIHIRDNDSNSYVISTDHQKVGETPKLRGNKVNNKIHLILKSNVKNKWEKRLVCATKVVPETYTGIVPTVCGVVNTMWVQK